MGKEGGRGLWSRLPMSGDRVSEAGVPCQGVPSRGARGWESRAWGSPLTFLFVFAQEEAKANWKNVSGVSPGGSGGQVPAPALSAHECPGGTENQVRMG